MPHARRTAIVIACSSLVMTMLCATSSAVAQRLVSGIIVDGTGARIPYAFVTAEPRRAVADDSGRFRLALGSGAVAIHARRIGYRPATVALPGGGDTAITLHLEPLARNLEAAVVEATLVSRALELRGFYRRFEDREKGINAGQFITAEEVDQRNPTRITQMLEGRNGLRVSRMPSGQDCPAFVCWAPQGVSGCWMTVYVDGRRINSLRAGSNTPAPVDEFLLPTHVAGIEVYTSPLRAPPEYQMISGTCGVVLFWTK
jgi:hypothetical protein